MRPLAALALASLLVLAGCSAPFTAGESGDNGSTQAPSSPASGPAAPTTDASSGGTAAATGASSEQATAGTAARSLADPPQDVLGWEGGYWHNESVPVVARDGLNASEQRIVVNRTMARIELIRRLEFTDTVPVEVISREEFQNRPGATGGGARSPAFQTFDNAKFESLFLIGENQNSLSVQQANRGQNVLGYYSPQNDSIVVVSPTATPQINRTTLAHELVHALQDQRFDLASANVPTRERYNARNGLIEGEANYVQRRYEARCDGQWRCLRTPSGTSTGGGSGDFHVGVYALEFFPYADGPAFIDAIYDREGWAGVNDLYDDVPRSTEQVIYPQKYGRDAPTNVSIRESNSNGWERVRPGSPGRPDSAVLGQSALSAMFGYTLYDQYNSSPVIAPQEFLNFGASQQINRTDPFDYDLNYTRGWDGDRMYVYQKNNETGYVWKLAWDSPEEAREFVRGYRQLLVHWGGERVLGRENVWEVKRDSPFADAFSVRQEGDTVTIVNAPETDDLVDVHESAGG